MKITISITIVLGLGLCSSLFSQAAGGSWENLQEASGQNIFDHFGSALAIGPDLDGDGFPEVAVSLVGREDSQSRVVGALQLLWGKTGQVFWTFQPAYVFGGPLVGEEVAFIPDLNADGIADIITGSQYALSGKGKVFILSGIDGSVIREHDGVVGYFSNYGEHLGTKVLGVSDLDGDGFGDYLYSSPLSDGFGGLENLGRVDCRSGNSGQLLWQTYGIDEWDKFGAALCQGPDLNGDMVPDILISSPTADIGFAGDGTVYCLDGISGQIIRTYLPPVLSPHQYFGTSIAAIPDLDGDSIDDYAVGASGTSTIFGSNIGNVTAISSATGGILWSTDGDTIFGAFGVQMQNVGDLDQDGFDDLVVRNPGNTVAQISILSGRDGRKLWSLAGRSFSTGFGASIGAFDRTGDGIPEILIGEPWSSTFGSVTVFSFEPFLYGETQTLSVSNPSPLLLRLDFPDTEAGRPFAILASGAGNSTTVLHGLAIPLVMDSYFQSSIQNPPASFRGALDVNGKGVVSVSVPPSRVSALVGSVLYFAAVTAGGGTARLSSVAVPVRVIP